MAVPALPSASKSEGRLGVSLQRSPVAGSCLDVFMMDMHVDVHIDTGTHDAASVVTFDQALFGQHLSIFVHPLDVAANLPREFTHRQHALRLQSSDQGPAAFGQPAEERAGAFEVQPLALVSVGPTSLARLPQGCTSSITPPSSATRLKRMINSVFTLAVVPTDADVGKSENMRRVLC